MNAAMRSFSLSALLGLSLLGAARGLEAQCIPFAVSSPGEVTPGELVDHTPGAVLVRDLIVDGTAPIVTPFDTYRSVLELVFPAGRETGVANGRGRLTTPLGALDYEIRGSVTGNPATREFSWKVIFEVEGGTGIFEGASGTATYEGTSDAETLTGVTQGVICLAQ